MPVKVTNQRIRNLLENVGTPLTNAEIRDALECNDDEANYISPRVRGMAKNPRFRIGTTMKDGKLAWYAIKGEGQKNMSREQELIEDLAAVVKKYGISRQSKEFHAAAACLSCAMIV